MVGRLSEPIRETDLDLRAAQLAARTTGVVANGRRMEVGFDLAKGTAVVVVYRLANLDSGVEDILDGNALTEEEKRRLRQVLKDIGVRIVRQAGIPTE